MNEEGFNVLLNSVLSRMKGNGASEDRLKKATLRMQSRKSLLLSKKVEFKLKKKSKQFLSKLSIPNPEDIQKTIQVREAVCGLRDWDETLEAFKQTLPCI